MPETEHIEHAEIVERLRALGDGLTTGDHWHPLLARARARRRRRSVAGIAAAAVVVALAGGGLALVRPAASTTLQPLSGVSPSTRGVDPWADPVPGPLGVPEPQAIPYRGGVRLALLRDTRGTYAVTAGMVGSAICVRVGAAVPAGAAPVQAASRCVDDVNRQLWLSSTLRVAGLQAAFVLVSPDATGLAWQQGGSVVAVELHDLPGSGRKVALLAAPRLADSALVATAGSQTLATLRIGPTPPLAPAEPAPTTTNAVALFGYEGGPRLPMTLWAQHEADGQVRFVGAGDDVPGLVDVFQGVPPGVDRPVREASLDRVAFGERWVCGTARTDVARVAYRLADGRTAPAALHDVPEGGRVWCVRLPHERLDQPPAGGDLIVATLSDGSRYEVTPKY